MPVYQGRFVSDDEYNQLMSNGFGNGFGNGSGQTLTHPSFMDKAFGYKDGSGFSHVGGVSAGLGIAQGIGNMYLGYKNYQLARDQLDNSRNQFAKNFGAQRTTTNNALRRQYSADLASSQGHSASQDQVNNYMDKYGVK